MHVWNVLHAARWKYRTQKWCKKSPSAHHRTTLSGYVFAIKASQQILTGFASWFRYCTDVPQRRSTKLCTMFGRLLGWYTLYIHFWGLMPLTEFCQVQYSLCVQVLRSPILAALLHGTRAVGVSQTLRRGTRNGITDLSLLTIFNRGRHLYSDGGYHVGHRPTF